MIARIWGGRVPKGNAEPFARHLLKTGVSDCSSTEGCRSVQLMRRDDKHGWSHFLLISIWETEEAMAAFSGPDGTKAVLYPGDDAFGLAPDLEVALYQVLPLGELAAGRAISA